MTLAVHQPNYLPWLGYFFKLSLCDSFLFYDTAEINKVGYTRRVKIRAAPDSARTTWLTVPLQSHADSAVIRELQPAWEHGWVDDHANILYERYHHCPGWDLIEKVIITLKEELGRKSDLGNLNIRLINTIASFLNIEREYLLASEITTNIKGPQFNLLAASELGATGYIRGKGEQEYGKMLDWEAEGIKVYDLDFQKLIGEKHQWMAGFPQWAGGLSIIDSLAYKGSDGILTFFQQLRQEYYPDLEV